ETFLVAEECKVPAAVAERRVDGASKFLNDVKLDIIVLDDAYQHRWIERDLNILIFDQRFMQKTESMDQKLLPLGIMREPFSAVDRADIIIINRKFNEKKEIPAKLKQYFEGKKIYTAYYETSGIHDVKNHQHYEVSDFKGQKSLVVCGIARPFSFLKVLENNGIDFTNKLLFADHKNYSHKEVETIRKKFYSTNAHSVLTTQKDAVKLTRYSKELDDIDIFYLKIDLIIEQKDEFENHLLGIYN
ncbi:MAG: tetraacyldisaccharide 4'-kinase, partial [Ignavibacteria bacterium GWB2_35_6b]